MKGHRHTITQDTSIYLTSNEVAIFHICFADSEEQAIQYTDEYIGVDREDEMQSMYEYDVFDITSTGIDPLWEGICFYEDAVDLVTVLQGQLIAFKKTYCKNN